MSGVDGDYELVACRVCGCTDHDACVMDDGTSCWWVEDDLCSACAEQEDALGRLRADMLERSLEHGTAAFLPGVARGADGFAFDQDRGLWLRGGGR